MVVHLVSLFQGSIERPSIAISLSDTCLLNIPVAKSMDSDSEWDLLECLPGDPWSIAIDHIQFDGKKNITTHELTHQIIEKPQRFNCQ